MESGKKQKIYIGISSCLLGQKVRFDANHKEQRFITQKLAQWFEFVPVCPEMAIGLGVPRTPIHLIGDKQQQRAVNIKDETIDVTQQLVEFGKLKARQLDFISGYIFKKGSPSCGLFNVKVYKSKNQVLNSGTGLYAQQIVAANPLLPVEEEGRLKDDKLRHNFFQRVEVYSRWQQLQAAGITPKSIIEFHARHKFMVLAHCETIYRSMGRLIAQIGSMDLKSLSDQYIAMLMTSLQKPSTRGKHTNVLEHIVGYFKRDLDSQDKLEIRKLIHDYRSGLVPRIVPLTLLKHHLRKLPDSYLQQQYYWNHCYSDI